MEIKEMLSQDKFKKYFEESNEAHDKWKKNYDEEIENINHDEPWLTLMSLYSIFTNVENSNISNKQLSAFTEILVKGGIRNLNLAKIEEIKVERKLPEIHSYRKYLKKLVANDNYHLYPDRRNILEKKSMQEDASFEGNTNLDVSIKGKFNNEAIIIFIEAKFLSDISYQITYNPVRDQIIRNIDAGIDYIDEHKLEFKNFYFLLLTPKVFRNPLFGEKKESSLNIFRPELSRLYSYKMEEYKKPENLKCALPHRLEYKLKNKQRHINESEWNHIANNIGWITFEDIIASALKKEILNKEEESDIEKFFIDRNLKDESKIN